MFKSYCKNTEGNVALVFSVSVLAMRVCVGAAVDFNAATSQKQNLQDIVDSATLAATKPNSPKENQLKGIVKKFVQEHNNGNKGKDGKISFEVKLIDDNVHVTGTSAYNTFFMGIVGREELQIVAQQRVARLPMISSTMVRIGAKAPTRSKTVQVARPN